MRKIFVVLLVLAIAGGALAQEAEDKGTWGTWSGSVSMSTEFDLSYFEPEKQPNNYKDNYEGQTTITGDQGGIELKLQWDYAKDNWTVAVPFIIDKDGAKVDGAKVEYEDGPLTVAIPFGVELGNMLAKGIDSGFAKYFKDVNIDAKYETDTYAFGAGMNNIFEKLDGGPSDYKAWGWYDFDILAGARLAVSYGGGYATEWWRASTIVLQGDATFWDDTSILTNERWAVKDDGSLDVDDDGFYYKESGYGYKWGDIADAGIAFKLNIIPELSIGFAFAGTKMFEGAEGKTDAVAPDPDSGVDGEGWLIGKNFFKHFLFGLGYESDVFSASAMLGFAPAKNKKGDPAVDAYIHAGLKVNIMEGISVGADISMVGFGGPVVYDIYKKPGEYKETKTEDTGLAFNAGAEVDVKTEMGLWANLKFAAIDLGDKTNFNAKYGNEYDNGYADTIENKGMQWGLGFQIGYDTDLSETLALGISAGVVVKDIKNNKIGYTPKNGKPGEQDLDYFYLGINPVLTWAVIENGTIEFSYKFGFETQAQEITNKLGIAFAWSF